MEPDHWLQIEALYHAALEREPLARASFLEEACAGDITIHEIGEVENTHYIVTEYVEGVTLRQRLTNAPQGRLSLPEALDLAVQIAAALAAAHGAGIIHRDLKPENVMVRRDGIVKVLDFGLAKLTEPSSPVIESQAATLARNSTDTGVVMGTPRYMSPEQARGEKVDARTDIFSLGVVVYEMLAGRAPFTGATASDCLAAILKDEPPELTEVNSKVPPQLERLVRRCLEKKPERRFHSAHDLGYALEELPTSSGARLETNAALPAVSEIVGASSVRKREWLGWAVAAALMLGMLGLTWAYFTRQPTPDPPVMKFSILPPVKTSFDHIAVSPDGKWLAFTATTGGKVQLWVRAFNATEAKPLAGTEGATYPFWSPDSRFIGFFVPGKLKKIEVSGGLPVTLCDAGIPTGGAWNRDGVILFSVLGGTGVSRVSSAGGEVTTGIRTDFNRWETDFVAPCFLPG